MEPETAQSALKLTLMFFYDRTLTPQEAKEVDAKLARFAKAMSHPTRIAILRFLAQKKCCYFGAIHEELPIAKATVSQHLKELREAGLIQGEIDPPKVKYCINRGNWAIAQRMFAHFFADLVPKEDEPVCCLPNK
jgi:DNA-binding HxlR family transcriptional regulator